MNPFVIPGVIVAVVAAVRGMWSPCGLSMISSITPMTERGRGNRFWVTGIWFTVGGLAGGVTLGAAMALGAWIVSLAHVPAALTVGLFVVAAAVTVASDLKLFGFALPIRPRQVNETWLRRLRAWAYASGFGWQIGTGFATYIMTGAVYLTAAVGVLSGDPIVALGIGALFGLMRGLCVFVAARATDHARLARLHARIEHLDRSSLDVAIGAQIVALVLLGVLAGYPVVTVIGGVGAVVAIVTRIVASRQVDAVVPPTGVAATRP